MQEPEEDPKTDDDIGNVIEIRWVTAGRHGVAPQAEVVPSRSNMNA